MANNEKSEKKPSPIKNPFRKRKSKEVLILSGEESDVTDDEGYLPTGLRFDPSMMTSATSESVMASYDLVNHVGFDSDDDSLTAPEFDYTFKSLSEDERETDDEKDDNEDEDEKNDEGTDLNGAAGGTENHNHNDNSSDKDLPTSRKLDFGSDAPIIDSDISSSVSDEPALSDPTNPKSEEKITTTHSINTTSYKDQVGTTEITSIAKRTIADRSRIQEEEGLENGDDSVEITLQPSDSSENQDGSSTQSEAARPLSPPSNSSSNDGEEEHSILEVIKDSTSTFTVNEDNGDKIHGIIIDNGESENSSTLISTQHDKENQEPQQQNANQNQNQPAPQSSLPPSALRKSSLKSSSTATTTTTTTTSNSSENSSSNTNTTVVRRSILRIGSRDRSVSPNDNTSSSILRTSSNGSITKKAVSFADENGGTIHKQHTIAVSPNKLTRRVNRRGGGNKQPFQSQFGDSVEDKMQEGVMGRVLVLLMDPPTKQYELTSLPYPLVSNDNGIVGPTQLSVLLGLVSKSASYEPLREKSYFGFCRPADGKELSNDLTHVDYALVKDEVLIAIPEGYNAEDCIKFSGPILQDKRLVRLLKKLKKHERKAERKRKMARKSMKPDRSGLGSSGFGANGSGDDFMDTKDGMDDSVGRDWASIVTGGVVMLFLSLFIVGAFNASVEGKSRVSSTRSRGVAKKETCLGRGVFCKPFGVQSQEENNNNTGNRNRIRWLQEISEWKLEGDDLMI